MRAYLRNKPYLVLWVFAALLFLISYLLLVLQGDTTLDINIHDTYFVISHGYVFRFLAVWLAFCGIGYWMLSRLGLRFFSGLTMAHLLLSLFGLLAFVTDFSFVDFQDVPKPYYRNTAFSYKADFLLRMLLFPLGQLLYFLNVGLSIVQRIRIGN